MTADPESPTSNTSVVQPRVQLWLDGRLISVTRVLKAAVGGVFLQGQAPGIHLGDMVQLTIVSGGNFPNCTAWHGVVTAISPGGTSVLVASGTRQLYGLMQNLDAKVPADGS